ncbi:MAG: exopolysaccharide biosynthesis protein [Hyphomonadaceae bacterium]
MSNTAQHPLEDVISTAIENADGDKVTVGELLDLYQHRSFGPIFTVLGLLTIIPPLSGIPGLPSVAALIIILFSVQMLLGMSTSGCRNSSRIGRSPNNS